MNNCSELSGLANIGPAALEDLQRLGVSSVRHLATCQADELYSRLNTLSGIRHDPCVWDVFAAAIHEARTGEKTKWWDWTAKRKSRQAAGTFV